MPHLDDTGENDDVVALLKQHHHIRDLFAGVENATADDRAETFRGLVRLLTVHETAEEEVVHPAARRLLRDGEQVVDDRLEESGPRRRKPSRLDDMDPDAPGYMPAYSVLTGWMGADLAGVKPGDVVAVWGCGAVGQMAARAAILLGAERVISIDRIPERLEMTERHMGSEVIDYTVIDVGAELRERTGGRGPDVCVEAVGMEAHSDRPVHLYDPAKQQLRLQTDRPTAVRQAIHACRKGGTVFVLGVFAGAVDKFPLGAVINKGLTVRGAQQHGQRYIPMLLDRLAAGELSTAHLATHTVPWTRRRGHTTCSRRRRTAACAR
ncbi:zinc-binding dehydrogenase [Streptomyces flavalbus]|uniref:Zinc-binding dehydrogenase n=1 Tax=Streptomyces flavalbus TaxID=2665155 RepID=A0ABW2WG11_9ACTN